MEAGWPPVKDVKGRIPEVSREVASASESAFCDMEAEVRKRESPAKGQGASKNLVLMGWDSGRQGPVGREATSQGGLSASRMGTFSQAH